MQFLKSFIEEVYKTTIKSCELNPKGIGSLIVEFSTKKDMDLFLEENKWVKRVYNMNIWVGSFKIVFSPYIEEMDCFLF